MGIQRVTDLVGDKYLTWKEGDEIIISTPTGSGKTTFIMRKLLLHACLNRKHIMYLCNRRALHDQSSSVLLFNIRVALQDDPELVDQLRVVFNAANESAEEIAARCARHFHVRTYQHCEKSGEYPNVDTEYAKAVTENSATTLNKNQSPSQNKELKHSAKTQRTETSHI